MREQYYQEEIFECLRINLYSASPFEHQNDNLIDLNGKT